MSAGLDSSALDYSQYLSKLIKLFFVFISTIYIYFYDKNEIDL